MVRQELRSDAKDVGRTGDEHQTIDRGAVRRGEDAGGAPERVTDHHELAVGKALRRIPYDGHEVVAEVTDRDARYGLVAAMTADVEEQHVVPRIGQWLGKLKDRPIARPPPMCEQHERLERLALVRPKQPGRELVIARRNREVLVLHIQIRYGAFGERRHGPYDAARHAIEHDDDACDDHPNDAEED